jgi:hypothetical protein
MNLEFHNPSSEAQRQYKIYGCMCHDLSTLGYIMSPKELRGTLKVIEMPKYASFEPVVIKTTGRCRELKIWFAGNGLFRMQCVVGSKADIEAGTAETIIWSGVQMTKTRAEEERKVWIEKREEGRKEIKERMKVEKAEREEQEKKEREEERIKWLAKEKEEKKKRQQVERKRAKWLKKYEDGDVDSKDMPEELRELDEDEDDLDEGDSDEDSDEDTLRSSAPPDSPGSSSEQEPWTDSESEHEEDEEEEE